MRPRNLTCFLKNEHLLGFNLMPCWRKRCNTWRTCSTCSSKVLLYTKISSRYGRQVLSLRSLKLCSTNLWKAAGALVSLKGIRSHSKSPSLGAKICKTLGLAKRRTFYINFHSSFWHRPSTFYTNTRSRENEANRLRNP